MLLAYSALIGGTGVVRRSDSIESAAVQLRIEYSLYTGRASQPGCTVSDPETNRLKANLIFRSLVTGVCHALSAH